MARFCLWSDDGDSLWLAIRLQREGHAVSFYVQDPHARDVGRGLVDLVPHPLVFPDSVILFDSAGHGAEGQAFRQAGHPVIGGNPIDTDLELDRPAAVRLAQSLGVELPETHVFVTIPEAIAFLEETEDAYFFKASENLSTALTYTAKTPPELIRWLRFIEQVVPHLGPFLLQKKAEGQEVSTEGWFDGTRFVPGSFNGTIEDKKLMPGNIGPRTGCQANVIWPWSDDAPLVALTVRRWEGVLQRAGYVGPFDVNAIITADGTPLWLENTPRFGFDAAQALTQLIDGNLGDVLVAFAQGNLSRLPLRRDLLSLTLRVSTPPFPADTVGAAEAVRGLPLDSRLISPPFFCDDVMLGDDGLPALSGRDGNVGCLGITGIDLPAMRRDLVRAVADLRVPNAQYRTDPVPRAEKVWDALAGFGYLRATDAPGVALALAA